jgi:hypothetical protein
MLSRTASEVTYGRGKRQIQREGIRRKGKKKKIAGITKKRRK